MTKQEALEQLNKSLLIIDKMTPNEEKGRLLTYLGDVKEFLDDVMTWPQE